MLLSRVLSAPEALAEVLCSELNRQRVKAERQVTSVSVPGKGETPAANYNVNIAFLNPKLLEHMSIIKELERESGQEVPQNGIHLEVPICRRASGYSAIQGFLVGNVLRSLKGGVKREYKTTDVYYFAYSD